MSNLDQRMPPEEIEPVNEVFIGQEQSNLDRVRIREQFQDNALLSTVLGTLLALVGLVVILSFVSDVFFSPRNLRNILTQSSIYVVLGVGMTLVLNTGGIDISVGSIVGLAASLAGGMLIGLEFTPWIGMLGTVLAGAALGLVNGLLIAFFKVPPIITTLGTWTAFRGLAFVYLEGTVHYGYPPEVSFIGRGAIFGIPVSVVIAASVAIWGIYFLNFTLSGSNMTAIGGNEEAARRAGINVDYYRGLAYVIMGTLSGIAAVIVTSRLDAAQATMGTGMELHAIAAVVIGGTALFGGRSTIVGTIIGVFILQVLENGLLLIGMTTFWQRVFLGGVVIVAVGLRTYKPGLAAPK